MAVVANTLNPLQQAVPIVDEKGCPTPYFMRQFLARSQNLQGAVPASRKINTAARLFGGGTLAQDLTLDMALLAPDPSGNFTSADITVDAFGRVTTAANGGGGGGGSIPLLPFPSNSGLNPNAGGDGFSAPAMAVVAAFAYSAAPVTGIYLPCNAVGTLLSAIPLLYGGVNPLVTLPVATGAALQATGPAVPLVSASIVFLPFTAPFVPVVGRWYYVGFAVSGTSAVVTFGAYGMNKQIWYNIGTFVAAPSVLPAMSSIVANFCPVWSS